MSAIYAGLRDRLYVISIAVLTAAFAGCDATPREAVALLRVDAETLKDHPGYGQQQTALLTSPYVLNGVLREPEVAQLEILKDKRNHVDWLAANLKV